MDINNISIKIDNDEEINAVHESTDPTFECTCPCTDKTQTMSKTKAPPLLSPAILKANRIIQIIFVPLMINVIVLWILSTSITATHNWECLQCRADKEPSVAQQFLFYSVWSFWFTCIVFVSWATTSSNSSTSKGTTSTSTGKDNHPQHKTHKFTHYAFQLALPHVITVSLCYIYYVITNPVHTFMNSDACYTWGRAFLGKTYTDNETGAMVYLVLMNIMDATVHYLSAPLMLYLFATQQLKYTTKIPYSTFFVIGLSAIMAFAEIYGDVKLYCGGRWFVLATFTAVNVIFHVLFYLIQTKYFDNNNNNKKKMNHDCCCDSDSNNCESDSNNKTIEPATLEQDNDNDNDNESIRRSSA